MFNGRLDHYRPSLRRWARAFAIVWLTGAGVMAPVSIRLLDQISKDAQRTSAQEIPSLLDQDRKAIKLERMSSFLRSIGSARDPRAERHVFLQLQTLAQGFDLDHDESLDGSVALAVSDARKVMALHASMRRLAADTKVTEDPSGNAPVVEFERTAQQVTDDGVQALNLLTDHLTTGAALSADTLANRIQQNAWQVERGSVVVLGFFFASGVLFVWIFQRHVLTPIKIAVRGLAAISRSDGVSVELPRARFFELDMIGRAVEQYARFADDLRAANLALEALSSEDGLTGLANRRSFDINLREACRQADCGVGAFALLLIDIDHFKRLNDSFGHLVGDQCLREVARTLQSFCSRHQAFVSRYGGEEFAVLLSDSWTGQAQDLAEDLRLAVERADIHVGDARGLANVTVSVGVASVTRGSMATPERVIGAADQALYRAKRAGRNCVRASDPNGAPPQRPQVAA